MVGDRTREAASVIRSVGGAGAGREGGTGKRIPSLGTGRKKGVDKPVTAADAIEWL